MEILPGAPVDGETFFEKAGPRQKIFFDPRKTRAAIVTYESGRTPFDVSFMDQLKELGVRTGYVLSGVDETESAADSLNWDMARALMNKIVRYAQSNNIDLEPDQLIDLMQILYPGAARSGVVDDRAVAVAVRLAA